MNSSAPRYVRTTRSYEASGSKEGGTFFDNINECYLFTKDTAPRRYSCIEIVHSRSSILLQILKILPLTCIKVGEKNPRWPLNRGWMSPRDGAEVVVKE